MSSNTRPSYEWGSVVIWVLTLFLWGLTTAHHLHGSGTDRFAPGLMSGVILAVVGGLIVAIVKYFKRSPTPDSNTALASAIANDKWIFYGSFVIAAFFIGMAIYFEKYGLLIDAVILVALGFGVKNGLGFARWLLATYAFISPIILVAIGSPSAIVWPIIFYVTCRSIKAHGYVDVAGNMENNFIPSSTHNIISQQSSFSNATQTAPISSGQRATAAALPGTVRTPATEAKPTMINPSPVSCAVIESSQKITPEIEERLYEQIAQEIETNTVDKGIWTKAFAQSGGDDKLTRVAYIKARFEKLMAMENTRFEAIQREREEIARLEQEQQDREREQLQRIESCTKELGCVNYRHQI